MSRFTVLLLPIAALALQACWVSPNADASQSRASAQPVRITSVTEAAPVQTVVLYSTTRSSDRATLAASIGGRLDQRSVQIGDTVVAGQAVASLDNSGSRNALRAASGTVSDLKARAAQQERTVDRLRALSSRGSLADAELEAAETGLASLRASLAAAEAQVSEARRNVRETTLNAPFDGVVTAVFAEPGEMIAAGQPVLAVSGAGNLEVALQVPERLWQHLGESTEVRVELPTMQRQLSGRVRDIGRNATPMGLFPVIIDLGTHAELPAGLTARVHIEVPATAALALPPTAIVDPTGQQPTVYVVQEGHAERIPVTIEGLRDGKVAVTGALTPDDQVVVAGQARLLDGDPVEVVQ